MLLHQLWCKKSYKFELKVYTDSYWVENLDNIKSTSGGAFFLGRSLISLKSNNKNCIFQSRVEVEYVVVSVNYSKIMLIKLLLEGMKEEINEPIVIYCDNTSVLFDILSLSLNWLYLDSFAPKVVTNKLSLTHLI